MRGQTERGNRTVAGRVDSIGVEPARDGGLLMIAYLTEPGGATVRVRMVLPAGTAARLHRELNLVDGATHPPG